MRSFHLSMTLRSKLTLIGWVLSCGLAIVGGVAWFALAKTQAVTQEVADQTAALRLLQRADAAHDGLRALVNSALLIGQLPEVSTEDTRKQEQEYRASMLRAVDGLLQSRIDPGLREQLVRSRPLLDHFLASADAVLDALPERRVAAFAAMPAFREAFESLEPLLEQNIDRLSLLNQRAVQRVGEVRDAAVWTVAGSALVCVLAMGALVAWMGRSIRVSLQRLEEVAAAVAGGEIDRRATGLTKDEIGDLGRVVNAMADKLQQMLAQALGDAEHHAFTNALGDALDMADAEPEAYRVVELAMAQIAPDRPMELLVSDSSHAMLQRGAEHPRAGAPGCPVDSPYACQAVRRGASVSFPDSDALNACPKLRLRDAAAPRVSAHCVPLHFMGRAVGVLHATGPHLLPLEPAQLAKLSAVGSQAAARIGVVRAFERSQLQAATDAATGLANRRSLEARLRELMRQRQPFALVMADLDRFKLLNDTHGHLVGDEALLLFADAVKRIVREGDVASRWGGEEFAIVLGGSGAADGVAWAERARTQLTLALTQHPRLPKFTASFGVADSTMAERLEDVLRIADDALYASKDAGRDRATLGHPRAPGEPAPPRRSEHAERLDASRLHTEA